MIWPDLATRARGLSSGLLSVADLERIDGAGKLTELAHELIGRGYPVTGTEPTADDIDVAIRMRGGRDLAILARWAGDRARALAVVLDDQDRRFVRDVVRGIAGHVPAHRRLSGAIPTPSLPDRVLSELAAATSTADLAAILRGIGHPYASAVEGAARVDEPVDVLSIETALARSFARRARRFARASRALALLVQQTIDVENACAAVLLSERSDEADVAPSYLAGGARLDGDAFALAATSNPSRARQILAPHFARTPIGVALRASAPTPELEDAALDWQLDTQTALRRTDPLGAAPILWLVLSRRREARRIRRAAWRVALGGAA